MDKENVMFAYNGLYSALEKEGNSDICHNIKTLSKWNKPATKKYDFILLMWGI